MKLSIFTLLFLFFVNLEARAPSNDHFLESQIEGSKYSVVYVELEETSSEDALRYALVHAAEMTHKNGYRYFTVDSEQEIVVARSKSKNKSMNSNIFQELIIENDMRMNSIERKSSPSNLITYPGLKILFTCYKERPEKGDAIDACSIIKCR